MLDITIREIAEVAGGLVHTKDPDLVVKRISTDSRDILPGDVFIALNGKNFNGNDYVKEVLSKGAVGIIAGTGVDMSVASLSEHLFVVDDTTKVMAKIARHLRKKTAVPVIAVTGTNGKTTVKEILAQLLSLKYKTHKSKKSFNNIIGLSLTLFGVEKEHEAIVLEIGTNHPGEISELASIAAPGVAIITNIGNGHLEFFGDKEGVFKEKTSLLSNLSADGIAFLNGNDTLLSKIVKGKNTKFFGTNEGADFLISSIKKKSGGYGFRLNEDEYFLPFEGEHNVHNAALAISVALTLGVDKTLIRGALEKVTLPDMRLEKVQCGVVTFINDSYNANPDSFESALRMLAATELQGKKIVVAGNMLELGKRAVEIHEEAGRSVAAKKFDVLIAVGELAAHIADGARRSGMAPEKIFIAKDHEEAAVELKAIARCPCVVLLKGSRGSKMEEIIKCYTISCTR